MEIDGAARLEEAGATDAASHSPGDGGLNAYAVGVGDCIQ
jgi:hypothetical protein